MILNSRRVGLRTDSGRLPVRTLKTRFVTICFLCTLAKSCGCCSLFGCFGLVQVVLLRRAQQREHALTLGHRVSRGRGEARDRSSLDADVGYEDN